jgi:hypothetical protein
MQITYKCQLITADGKQEVDSNHVICDCMDCNEDFVRQKKCVAGSPTQIWILHKGHQLKCQGSGKCLATKYGSVASMQNCAANTTDPKQHFQKHDREPHQIVHVNSSNCLTLFDDTSKLVWFEKCGKKIRFKTYSQDVYFD